MLHGGSQELSLDLMKKVSSTEDDEGENRTPSYPGTSADNHHKIPRTQFNSTYGPPGAADGGNEGEENNN